MKTLDLQRWKENFDFAFHLMLEMISQLNSIHPRISISDTTTLSFVCNAYIQLCGYSATYFNLQLKFCFWPGPFVLLPQNSRFKNTVKKIRYSRKNNKLQFWIFLDEFKRNESRHMSQKIMSKIASESKDSKHFHRKFFLLLIVWELLLANQVDHVRA